MITMKEQADQFRKLLHHMNAPKKTTNTGIAVPYENLANSCIEFAPGECYSFFGKRDTNTLSCWKTSLLLKLLQNGVSVCVLEGGDTFRHDFAELACLQAKIDPDRILSGQGDVEDFQAFTLGLKEIAFFPMVWTTDEGIPSNLKGPMICVKNMTLDEWQNEAEALWVQAKERNVVLFLFVMIPRKVSLSFYSLYHPHKIIVPENLSSYVCIVKTIDLPAEQQRTLLNLTIKRTESFTVEHLDFDIDPHSREISVASHI